jgi:hypothetical protein
MGGTVGANRRAPDQAPEAAAAAPGLEAAGGPAGVTLTDTPQVAPTSSPDGTVTAGSAVSATVVVLHDGKSETKSSTAPTVGILLEQMGLRVSTLDKVTPGLTAPLPSSVIRIVRVTQTTERQNIEVPFRQITRRSDRVELGIESLAQTGAKGLSQKVFRKTFQDGNLVSTVLAGTNVIRQPRDEIKLIGSHVPTCSCRSGSAEGNATWYSIGGLTSASPTLPFGTVVRVTNLGNGRSVNVVIRDRGPYAGSDRIIDLSPTAFAQIGALGSGIVNVRLQW